MYSRNRNTCAGPDIVCNLLKYYNLRTRAVVNFWMLDRRTKFRRKFRIYCTAVFKNNIKWLQFKNCTRLSIALEIIIIILKSDCCFISYEKCMPQIFSKRMFIYKKLNNSSQNKERLVILVYRWYTYTVLWLSNTTPHNRIIRLSYSV